MTVKVLASIRSAKLDQLESEVEHLEAGGIDGFHVDVMDGHFVEDLCFDAAFTKKLRKLTTKLIDVHLLTNKPADLVDGQLEAGADRLMFHLEVESDPTALCDRIREAGRTPGLVILPTTGLEALRPHLGSVGVINPLGVDPVAKTGFVEETYARVATLVRWRGELGLDYVVQADGGVWEKTRDGLAAAGADELVGGYPIFSTDDYAEAIRQLREGR